MQPLGCAAGPGTSRSEDSRSDHSRRRSAPIIAWFCRWFCQWTTLLVVPPRLHRLPRHQLVVPPLAMGMTQTATALACRNTVGGAHCPLRRRCLRFAACLPPSPHLCIPMQIVYIHVMHEVRHTFHAFVAWSLRANTSLTFRVRLRRSSDKQP